MLLDGAAIIYGGGGGKGGMENYNVSKLRGGLNNDSSL